MKRRAVIYAPDAGDDLDRIYEIVADASSATTANCYDQRIRTFCEKLEYGADAAPCAITYGRGFASSASSDALPLHLRWNQNAL